MTLGVPRNTLAAISAGILAHFLSNHAVALECATQNFLRDGGFLFLVSVPAIAAAVWSLPDWKWKDYAATGLSAAFVVAVVAMLNGPDLYRTYCEIVPPNEFIVVFVLSVVVLAVVAVPVIALGRLLRDEPND